MSNWTVTVDLGLKQHHTYSVSGHVPEAEVAEALKRSVKIGDKFEIVNMTKEANENNHNRKRRAGATDAAELHPAD